MEVDPGQAGAFTGSTGCSARQALNPPLSAEASKPNDRS